MAVGEILKTNSLGVARPRGPARLPTSLCISVSLEKTAPSTHWAGNAERIARAAYEGCKIQYGPVHLSRILAHEPVGGFLQPSVIANISELAWTNEPLDHAGHVHVKQRCSVPVLELQDRIGNVLPDRGDLAMFPRIRWELSFVLGSIFRDTEEGLGTATPQPKRSQESLKVFDLGRGKLGPAGILCNEGPEESCHSRSCRALEEDLDDDLLVCACIARAPGEIPAVNLRPVLEVLCQPSQLALLARRNGVRREHGLLVVGKVPLGCRGGS